MVLDGLIKNDVITEACADRLWPSEHSGFPVNNKAHVRANDQKGRRQFTRCMIRNPFALEEDGLQGEVGRCGSPQ